METQRPASTPAVTPPEKSKGRLAYSELELEKLLALTCARREDGMGVERLPQFWRDFQNYRGTVATARTYLEQFFEQIQLVENDCFEFNISNPLVNTLRELRFHRSRRGYNYNQRCHGASVFAWAPDYPSSAAENEERVATTERLERTLHNHQDSQQIALDALAGNGKSSPQIGKD